MLVVFQCRQGSHLRQPVDVERRTGTFHIIDYVLAGQHIAHPQAGQPVHLGEGTQHDQVLPTIAEICHAAPGIVGISDGVLVVRLVHHHRDALRDALQERLYRGGIHRRAGGVVGVAHKHQARAVGDGIGHRLQVVGIPLQRNLHQLRPHLDGTQQIADE